MVLTRFILPIVAASLVACSPTDTDTEAMPASEAPATPTATAEPGVWQTLFDGTDLERWNVVGDANWEIVDDTVRADSSSASSFLVSDVDYGDFDLSLEFWVNVEANSGIFIRCMNPEQITDDSCYEINIYDTRTDQTYRTGAIVNHAPPAAFLHAGGRWNNFEISAHGNRLQVTMNGVAMVDIEDPSYASGPIALQYGSGTVIFRNVRIRTQ